MSTEHTVESLLQAIKETQARMKQSPDAEYRGHVNLALAAIKVRSAELSAPKDSQVKTDDSLVVGEQGGEASAYDSRHLNAIADEMQMQHDDGRAPWLNQYDIDCVRHAASLPRQPEPSAAQECICAKCGLRHGGGSAKGDF